MCVTLLEHLYSLMVRLLAEVGSTGWLEGVQGLPQIGLGSRTLLTTYTQNHSVYNCLKLGDVRVEGNVCYITAVML